MHTTVRYRARMGHPRSTLEHVLQWLWHWRIELALFYISIGVALVILFELRR